MIPRFYFTGIKPTFKMYKHFGLVLPTRLLWYILLKVIYHSQEKARYFNNKKHLLIEKWLMKRYGSVLKQEPPKKTKDYNPETAPIWVFWWDGFDSAPILVKKCLKYMELKSGSHPIIRIDKNNFKNYVSIPDYIIKKVESKHITLTHFSDILRVNLLYENGGLWADSTVLFANKISSDIFTKDFFSIRIASLDNFSVTDYQWSGFFISSPPQTNLMYWMKNFFNEYWEKESYLIDYLLIDYFFDIIRKNDHNVSQLFESIPFSNPELYSLINCFNHPFDINKWMEMKKSTSFFKLSYRKNFITNNDSNDTFYSQLLDQKL